MRIGFWWGDSWSFGYGYYATWCFRKYEAQVGEREGRASFACLTTMLIDGLSMKMHMTTT